MITVGGWGVKLIGVAAAFLLLGSLPCWAGEVFLIQDAIRQAVQTHPNIGEAAANRRATETELRQNQSTLLPQVRLEARTGPELFNNQDIVPPVQGNNQWLNGRSASVVVRQLLFDGFASLNQIWRQAARVDAAAYRVRERTELTALDAAEAYIDVVRYTRLVAIAQENMAAHRKILGNVEARFQGGRAGEGDLQQTQERVAAAEAALADFRRSYDDAKAAYRKTVGLEPFNLRAPGRLQGLPTSRDESLALALRHNPTIQAAQADADAAKYDFHATTGDFVPNVSLEGRALRGNNSDTIFGYHTDVSGKLVVSWDVFKGGQDTWHRAEMAERYTESTMHHAKLQRDALESIDKAWNARTITADRIVALQRQIGSDRRVITAYQKEYELGQRSLIDLLNGENQLFNALVSLESSKGVIVFADYQLLAAVGHLLDYLHEPHPVDSEPIDPKPFGLIPTRLPPVILTLPDPSQSEPLSVNGPVPPSEGLPAPTPVPPRGGTAFLERWPRWSNPPDYAAMKSVVQPGSAATASTETAPASPLPTYMYSFAPDSGLKSPSWPTR
jgi:adhesin transport system outer membrane protein